MAQLKRQTRWVRVEPDFAGNLELPPDERFYFLLAASLTREELQGTLTSLTEKMAAVQRAIQAKPENPAGLLAEALAEGLNPVVRFGDEPLVVDGQAITNLRDYFALGAETQADLGGFQLEELTAHLRRVNSFTGARALFYERPSGGGASTARRSSASGSSQKAAQPSGSPTSRSASSG